MYMHVSMNVYACACVRVNMWTDVRTDIEAYIKTNTGYIWRRSRTSKRSQVYLSLVHPPAPPSLYRPPPTLYCASTRSRASKGYVCVRANACSCMTIHARV